MNNNMITKSNYEYSFIHKIPHLENVGYDGSMAIPQIPGVLVLDDLAIQTYPLFPHDAPHEFLTIQYGCDPCVL